MAEVSKKKKKRKSAAIGEEKFLGQVNKTGKIKKTKTKKTKKPKKPKKTKPTSEPGQEAQASQDVGAHVPPQLAAVTDTSVVGEPVANPKKKMRSGKRKRSKKKKEVLAEAVVDVASSLIPKATGSIDQTTVYVDGIPFGATADDLRGFFAECGKIVEIRFPLWQDSGRSRGYAHVAFKKAKGFEAALARSGDYLQSRYLRVMASNERKETKRAKPDVVVGCKSIFVKNLPYDSTEDALREAFEEYGTVTGVRLAQWNHTQNRKGFGYVDFDEAESAAKACAGETTVGGRITFVDFETGKPRHSFKTGEGRNWVKLNGTGEEKKRGKFKNGGKQKGGKQKGGKAR